MLSLVCPRVPHLYLHSWSCYPWVNWTGGSGCCYWGPGDNFNFIYLFFPSPIYVTLSSTLQISFLSLGSLSLLYPCIFSPLDSLSYLFSYFPAHSPISLFNLSLIFSWVLDNLSILRFYSFHVAGPTLSKEWLSRDPVLVRSLLRKASANGNDAEVSPLTI